MRTVGAWLISACLDGQAGVYTRTIGQGILGKTIGTSVSDGCGGGRIACYGKTAF